MATIQVRDVPDDVYDEIRRRADDAGVSLQAYMRARVIEFGRTPTAEEAWRHVEDSLARHGPSGLTGDEIVAALHADRR